MGKKTPLFRLKRTDIDAARVTNNFNFIVANRLVDRGEDERSTSRGSCQTKRATFFEHF